MTGAEMTSAAPRAAPGAAYVAKMEQRRSQLTAILEGILRPGTPFVWELGCGHGHFLTAYAHAHPDRLCIGIDIASDRITRALRKRDRAQLSNLHFVQAEARLFLETLPPDAQLAEAFVLFPDPWPKLRHHKHRVMQPDFLFRLADRMTPHGRLAFRTDDPAYFDATHRVVATHPRWQLVSEPWPFEYTTVFQSRASSHRSLLARQRPHGTDSVISMSPEKDVAANESRARD